MWGPRLGQALILIPFAFGAAAARAQEATDESADSEHYQLRGEVGVEYDSNAHRVEQLAIAGAGVVGSFLQRLVLTAQGADQVTPRHAVAWSATAAAKIFDA